LPSTPSSTERGRRPSRAALVALVIVCLAVPAAVLGFALTRDSAKTSTTTHIRAGIGKPAPDFRLPTTDGRTVSLSHYRGRPVVIAFFASWCHPCEEELPVLEKVQREQGKRLQVIGVNYQDHIGTDSADFVHRLGVTFPAALQPDGDPIAAAYGVHEIPQTFFVDGAGVVRDRIFGDTSRTALQPSIDALFRRGR
jgi:cytochrome c biogenesis protein CcmG, thiol:disulfide interchange protein DsbE